MNKIFLCCLASYDNQPISGTLEGGSCGNFSVCMDGEACASCPVPVAGDSVDFVIQFHVRSCQVVYLYV